MTDYRIEIQDAFPIVCRKVRCSAQKEMPGADLAQFWQQCGADGTIETLARYIPEDNIFGSVSSAPVLERMRLTAIIPMPLAVIIMENRLRNRI